MYALVPQTAVGGIFSPYDSTGVYEALLRFSVELYVCLRSRDELRPVGSHFDPHNGVWGSELLWSQPSTFLMCFLEQHA